MDLQCINVQENKFDFLHKISQAFFIAKDSAAIRPKFMAVGVILPKSESDSQMR